MLGSEQFNPREMAGVVERFGAGEQTLVYCPYDDAWLLQHANFALKRQTWIWLKPLRDWQPVSSLISVR